MRVKSYSYVGNYYGNCTEVAMMKELLRGPVAVSFEATEDFEHYTGGIYVAPKTKLKSVNEFEETNHCVMLVGYGEEKGVKYWRIKNSWGRHFGEGGYFRIRRGTNELNVESMAEFALPIRSKD